MVSPLSNGYINCPGIYDSEQVAGWKLVTQAAHAPQSKSLRDRREKIFL